MFREKDVFTIFVEKNCTFCHFLRFFSRAPVLYEETVKDNEKNEPKNWQLDIKSLGSTF